MMTSTRTPTMVPFPVINEDMIGSWDIGPDMIFTNGIKQYYITAHPKRVNVAGTDMATLTRYNLRLEMMVGRPKTQLRPATPEEKEKVNPSADTRIRLGAPIRISGKQYLSRAKLTAKQVFVVTSPLKNGEFNASPLGGSDRNVYYKVPAGACVLAEDVLEAFGK